jgi:hypothetical protein
MNLYKYIRILIVFLILFPVVEAQAQGFTVTSVSTSDVITKKTDPATVWWLINTQLNGGGQSITGSIEPSTIKNFMGGKIYTTQTLSLGVDSLNEQVFYDVINEGTPIYRYKLETFYGGQTCVLGVCAYTADPVPCSLNVNWDIPLGKSIGGYAKKRYCITKEQKGVKGVYNNPVIGFKAKIRLSVGSSIKEKTICSGSTSGCDGSSVSFDDVGVATWSGSLITGEPAPNQNNFVAIKKLSSNGWQIARKSTFESYLPHPANTDTSLNSFKNLYSNEKDEIKADTEIYNAITPANQASDSLLNEDTSFTYSPFNKDSNTGKVTVTLQRSLTSPNVVFRIRADWIGIFIPSGLPKINGITADKFASGETGTVNVQIQNIGEAAGTFSAMLLNCDPFIQSTSSQTSRKTLQPGDADTIPISVSSGTISENLIKACSVKVYDINDPSIEVTSSVTLQLEKAKVCIPDKMFANGNIINKCSKDGSTLEIVENCKYGVVSDGKGGFDCLPEPVVDKAKVTETIGKPKVTETVDKPKVTDCGELAYFNQDVQACVQKSGCLNILNNGDPNKNIDIAFVGDGYFDNEELNKDVIKIVDYEGNNGINGLMSVEPFKSNGNKFNIWMIKAGNQIPMVTISENFQGPDRDKSLEIAAECSSADYKIVLSKKEFRSYAFTDDAYLSLGSYSESGWGRLLLHEFGHTFGKLADEYVDPPMGNRPHPPNCAPDIATAQKWWGSTAGTGFYGCSYTETNIRPYFNSIMRNQLIFKDDYGEINEAAILKILNKYG